MTKDLNGFSKRVEKIEEEQESTRSVNSGLLASMAESREHRKALAEALTLDRKHVSDQLERIQRMIERLDAQRGHS